MVGMLVAVVSRNSFDIQSRPIGVGHSASRVEVLVGLVPFGVVILLGPSGCEWSCHRGP